MKSIVNAFRWLVITLIVLAVIWAVIANYSFVFSKKVKGEVVEVERVVEPTAILGRNIPAEQIFSFAVMIRAEDGTIFSASSEDRQWAVAKKGYCVEARFYPYPPWDFEKLDTYYNARLLRVYDCAREKSQEQTPSPESGTPAE